MGFDFHIDTTVTYLVRPGPNYSHVFLPFRR